MQDFKIISTVTKPTLKTPNPNTVKMEFVKGGENFGGRLYNLTDWTIESAKEDFIKWCGY